MMTIGSKGEEGNGWVDGDIRAVWPGDQDLYGVVNVIRGCAFRLLCRRSVILVRSVTWWSRLIFCSECVRDFFALAMRLHDDETEGLAAVYVQQYT